MVDRADDDPGYVSRGGHKLAGRARRLRPQGLRVEGRRALDAGACTGGFTDVLLRRGVARGRRGRRRLRPARLVACRPTTGSRSSTARTSATLTLEQLSVAPVDLVVGDLSFISLALVLPALRVGARTPDADLRAHGEAAVRGRTRAARLRRGRARRRRCGPRRCVRSRSGPAASVSGPRRHREPAARVRRVTSSTSCGCAPARRRPTRRPSTAPIEEGPQ